MKRKHYFLILSGLALTTFAGMAQSDYDWTNVTGVSTIWKSNGIDAYGSRQGYVVSTSSRNVSTSLS